MKLTHIATFASIVALSLASTTAAAGSSSANVFKPLTPLDADEQANNYLGASIGQSSSDDFCQDLQDCTNNDKNWKLFAGMRLNENIVLEGGYANLGTLQGKDPSGNAVSQDTTAFTVAGVAGFPLNDQIEVFGKAGAARWSAQHHSVSGDDKETGTDVLVGAGANYDLGDNMGIRAEWERFKDVGKPSLDTSGDIDLLSVGVTFSSL